MSERCAAPRGGGSIILSQMLQPLHTLHMLLAALRLRVYDGDVGEAELPAVVKVQSSTLHYSTVQYSTVPAVVPGVPVSAGVGAGGAPPAHADLGVPGARVDLVASEQ